MDSSVLIEHILQRQKIKPRTKAAANGAFARLSVLLLVCMLDAFYELLFEPLPSGPQV